MKYSASNHKEVLIGKNFKLSEVKQSIDLRGDFMKLFNFLPKYLTAFKYKELNLNKAPKEIDQYILEFPTFWDKENPTN